MTVELADYLLGLEKYILIDGELKKSFFMDIHYPMSFRLYLTCPEDPEQSLMVDIWESEKRSLKIALHHQDDNTQFGLLRVDFNSRHKNPETILETVPEVFHKYAGIYLDDYQGHIHYTVDGYSPLHWALPLEADDFPVKTIQGRDDYYRTLGAFFNKINLKTDVTFNTQLRIV